MAGLVRARERYEVDRQNEEVCQCNDHEGHAHGVAGAADRQRDESRAGREETENRCADAAAVRQRAVGRVGMKRPRCRELARNEKRRAQPDGRPVGQQQRDDQQHRGNLASLTHEAEHDQSKTDRGADRNRRLLSAAPCDRGQDEIRRRARDVIARDEKRRDRAADARAPERPGRCRRRQRELHLPLECGDRRQHGAADHHRDGTHSASRERDEFRPRSPIRPAQHFKPGDEPGGRRPGRQGRDDQTAAARRRREETDDEREQRDDERELEQRSCCRG